MHVAALLLVLFSTPRCESVVDDFYRTHVTQRTNGIPEDRFMFSARLQKRLAAAARERDRFIRQHPDDKPPFVDGDLFTSLFEGAQSFEIANVRPRRGGCSVQVNFKYEDVRWSDTVIVKKERGRYVIEDIHFSGAGQFNPPGKLSDALRVSSSRR